MASRKRPRDEFPVSTTCLWRGCASAAFNTPEELFEHVNTVHVTQKGPCLWDDCEYVGKAKHTLQKHIFTHTGEKPHVCEVCDAAFAEYGNLTTHKRRHTGEKPHICDVCDAAFIQSGALTIHKRIHTDEKPYKCTSCTAAFVESGALTKHKRIHTGEKPHVCEVCDAAFAEYGNLTTHKRRHTGEKPHICDVCDAAFIQSGALTIHKRIHTGEKPYKCTSCTAAFVESGALVAHKIRKHIGPWCIICGECYVPDEIQRCGRCNMGKNFGAKEKKFFEFIYAFDERLDACYFTLRDEVMGCGVRKRPDALMQLKTKAARVTINNSLETLLQEDDYQVKLIIEADENQHQAYMPSCELARLQQIQERDNDAIYVLRYNVDQPGGLEEEKLTEFCKHVLHVLDGGFIDAIEEVSLIKIEYFGYSENRIQLLRDEMARQQNEFEENDD